MVGKTTVPALFFLSANSLIVIYQIV